MSAAIFNIAWARGKVANAKRGLAFSQLRTNTRWLPNDYAWRQIPQELYWVEWYRETYADGVLLYFVTLSSVNPDSQIKPLIDNYIERLQVKVCRDDLEHMTDAFEQALNALGGWYV